MTNFRDTVVREVMVPRPDMVTIPAAATVREALELAVVAGVSCLPALDPTIDQIAGLAHARDLVRAQQDGRGGDSIRRLLRPAHFVPETKRAAELLSEMQDGHFDMAIAVDEYGGTAGLATLKDLVEELIGETPDEHDVEERLVEPQGDGTVSVSGSIRVDELNELLGTELPTGDWDTAAGLLCALLGRVPTAGEAATCGEHELRAERVWGRRVTRISIRMWAPFDRVVVPVDFGPGPDRAFPVAQAVARTFGARLDAMVVTSAGVDARDDEREARWHARSVGCQLDGVELRTDDHAVDGILAVAREPRTLLCMATHARDAPADLVVHSVSEQVIRRSPGPVMVVGPRTVVAPPPRLDALVCCIGADISLARRLVPVVAQWSDGLGCDPALLHVTASDAQSPADRSDDPAISADLAYLTRRLSVLGVNAASQRVSDADPATGILRFARGRPGAVIVMASHGRTGLRRVALGSVTLDVLRRSPRPVLVVPPRASADGT
jgi:Mg2+/Co2+ transporter CorC/nucleotide-binding universal stress UspA family protein